MSPRRIVFIEPASDQANVFDNYMRLPLTGSLYLGTILHRHGYEVKILNEVILRTRLDPFDLQADVFCITALTVSANRARLLAAGIRRFHPQAKVLIGGIHASILPQDFVEVADHVVVGEAEGIIVDLVEGKFAEKIVRGCPVEDIEALPLLNYRLLEGHQTLDIVPIMTSRGCPFDCNFCTVTRIFGKRFRMQSPERVVAEVKNALATLRTRDIFFYDDNFTANRERVERICELLLAEKIEINWTAQVRADVARDPELLRQMARAGARWFYIGFESISDATLKSLHKSQTRRDIEKAIQAIHQVGINIHGMFIFGADTDTVEILQQTVDFAISEEIDTVQFMVLTPFPGTRLHAQLTAEGRILHNEWQYCNGLYAMFQPRNMSASRLQKETILAYKRFYSLRRLLLDLLTIGSNVCLDALVWNFGRVFRYGLDLVFLKAGASLIIGRYARGHDRYLGFLSQVEAAPKVGPDPSGQTSA